MSIPITSTQEYKQLTKVLEILELQREQVIKDKEFIENAYKEAIKNPIEYIESLVSGTIRLPPKTKIINVPDLISLPTYNSNNNQYNNIYQRNVNRNSITDNLGDISKNSFNNEINSNKSNNDNIISTNSNISGKRNYHQSDTEKSDSCLEESETDNRRPPKPFKPHSKSNLAYWTEEEQDRLEKLLVEFPEEEVATHRWTKIANALGNRTPAQVASRTQKYFKKLERLGKEIPGSRIKKKRSGSSVNSMNNKNSENSQVQSSEDEIIEKKHKSSSFSSISNKPNNNSMSGGNNNKSKSQQKVHEGYKCDGCDIEPIVGIRWHCEECMDEVDLCSKCHDELEEIGKHLSSHHMTAFENPDSYFLDDDYKYTYPSGESNYLDPNYR